MPANPARTMHFGWKILDRILQRAVAAVIPHLRVNCATSAPVQFSRSLKYSSDRYVTLQPSCPWTNAKPGKLLL